MLKDILNKNLTSGELLNILKSIDILRESYSQRVRHYILERHTEIVLNEFQKYFSASKFIISNDLFKLILALHDIGKPRAFREGDINKQYEYSIEIIHEIQDELPYVNADIAICIALISNDPIGLYFQNKISIIESKNMIAEMSKKCALSVFDFFELITVYYQCDIASYTKDAGGLRYLEHLFLYSMGNKMFDEKSKMLKFSSNFERDFELLKQEVTNAK